MNFYKRCLAFIEYLTKTIEIVEENNNTKPELTYAFKLLEID